MDTGPLWTFAQVGRLDLLGVRIAHRMIWTGAVHSEIDRNVQNHAFLADVLDLEWLPEPVQLEGPLALRAFEVRAGLSAPRDHPNEHLGEAESIVLALDRGAEAFLTADRDAARRAKFDRVKVIWPTDVVVELVHMDDIRQPEAEALIQQMKAADRIPSDFDLRSALA